MNSRTKINIQLQQENAELKKRIRDLELDLATFRRIEKQKRVKVKHNNAVAEQKSAEEALRESEQKYQDLFEKSKDAILIICNHKFVDCNQAAVQMLGYNNKKELLQTHPSQLSPATQPDGKSSLIKADEMISIALKNGSHKFEWDHVRANGEVFPVEVLLTTISNEEGNQVLHTVWRDITNRKRSEEALKAAELKYRTVADFTYDWEIWQDSDGSFRYVSPSCQRITGYMADEYYQNQNLLTDIILPEDQHSWKNHQRAQEENPGQHETEFRIRRKDGQVRWIEHACQPVHDERGNCLGVRGSNRDITDRKRDEAVQSAQMRLIGYAEDHTVTELLQKFLDEAEILTGSAVGFYHFLEDDQETLLLQTWSTNTLQNMCTAEGVQRHYAVSEAGVWVDCIRERKPVVYNDYGGLPHKKGLPEGHAPLIRILVVPVFREEKIVAILGVGNKKCDYEAHDVKTLQKMADLVWETFVRKQAQEETILLMSAVEQTDEIIIITDPQMRIKYVNPAFSQTTGYSRGEVIGRTPSILKSGKHDDLFYQELLETISDGKVWKGYFTNKKKDGTLYEEYATITPIKNTDGHIKNYVAVKSDTTAERKIQDQLRQSQKMESIGTLAGGIAHDFNNILAVILGCSELAADKTSERPELAKLIREILKAGVRAKDLVGQILMFSRSTKMEKKALKAVPIIKEVCKFLRSTIPSSIEIRQNITSKSDLVMADPTQLHQVLMNLSTNACHAMKERGGVLEISLEDVLLSEDTADYPDLKGGPYLKLTVKDTGHGMDTENLNRIFEPYFTSKEQGEGTGLGLAVVHGIIKDHGGAIKVTSEINKGTTFEVLYPRMVQPAALENLDQERASVPGGTESILFVDDEEAVVFPAKLMLERLGYCVVGVTSASEAIEAMKKNKDAFDLLITDKTMPKMNGFDLAREIRILEKDIPIIICTGFEDQADKMKAQGAGISALIRKPIRKEKLASVVRDVLDSKTATLILL